MKILLIDDESLNLRSLRELLESNFPQVDIVGEAHNGQEGLELIYRTQPDLLLLDIEMPDMTGFGMLERLHSYPFAVIFVTAHSQYGIQAVKMSALDYLLKPVRLDELGNALQKAEERIRRQQNSEQIASVLAMIKNPAKPRLAISLPSETRLVDLPEVMRIESKNNYTKVILRTGEKLVVSKGIYEYEDLLQVYRFARCHQSHIVNLEYVKRVVYLKGGGEIYMLDGTMVPLARTKKEFIREFLQQHESGVIW
jgi:two-component system LytT family response regulator